MNALLAGGMVACAYAVGRWAIDGHLASGLRRSALARIALGLVLGIALLTPPMIVLAAAGLFQIQALGALGWIVAALTYMRRPFVIPRWPLLDLSETLVMVAVVVFGVAAAVARDETLGVGRDQQVYAESAVALSERGHAWMFFAPTDEADQKLLRATGGVNILGLSQMRNGIDRPIRPTHPLGWPVWLALAHFSFGIDGLYGANAIVFAFGGVLFFLLLRRLVASGIAVVATCLFLSLPSSIWIAGISLSEPLAMTVLLAVPLVGSAGIKRSRWRIAILLLAATLIRIDAALLFPAVIAALALSEMSSWTLAAGLRRRFVLAQVIALAAALSVYLAFYPGYLRNVLYQIATIVAATVGLGLIVVFITPRIAFGVRRIMNARTSRLVAIVAVIALFVYAAAIRPMQEPFSIIRQLSGLNGMRDFREESLLNLATYVSWPILLLGVGGICYAIQDKWAIRRWLFRPLLLVLGICPALLYLWSPQVSPDHPWAVRRFVPTIIPYIILFAALFVHLVTRRFGHVGATAGALILAAPYALIVSKHPPQLVFMRENEGMTSQLTRVANELPDALIVDVGADENMASALFVAFGKPVLIVPSGAKNKASIARVTTWIQEKSKLGRPAWLLHGPNLWRTGVEISDQREWSIPRKYLTPTNQPPVTGVTALQTQLLLSRIDRLDPTFATRMFGGERIWGARDGGFFESEVAPFGQFRYTDGQAWIEVPADALWGARALKVDVFSYAKQGTSRWISVLVDGRAAWTGDVGPGVSTLQVPVSEVVDGDTARIEILSQAVDPAEMNADDARVNLSIGLIGIRPLHADEPRASGPGMEGFRSHLASIGLASEVERIRFGQSVYFVLDVTNTGREYWPSVRELRSPKGAVQIALRWYRHDKPDALVGDNRWALSISMLPGDCTRLQVPLAPVGIDGKPLPPGEYDVHIGMVRETVALFADNGDEVLSIPVVVAP